MLFHELRVRYLYNKSRRLANFSEQFSVHMIGGIYIDDTGTPGTISKSKYDSTDRKSWLALILTASQRKTAYEQMRGCLLELNSICNASEFHFTDIYNGKGEFKSVTLSVRLGIFRTFAEIFRLMKYPMLIQTFTSDDLLRNKIVVANGKVKLDGFTLKDPGEFALFFLLFRIKKYLLEQITSTACGNHN